MKNQQFYVKTARLAVPIMMQNMITIGVNMADNIMVGSLGENALSAVALANQFINIYQFSCMGLGQGASIMTSRFWGMKNEKALKQTIAITTRICLVLGILFTVITWCFPEIIMKIFISEPAVISQGVSYLKVLSVSCLLMGLSLAYSNVYRSVGNAKWPLFSSIGAFFLNIGCNYIFIFGKFGAPELGVTGAALGTLIARIFEFVFICMYLIFFDKKEEKIMVEIQTAAGQVLVSLALGVISLLGAFGLFYIRKGGLWLDEKTKQLKDEKLRKQLDDALDDVENLARVTVGAIEQTTAKAIREAVKDGKTNREELTSLSKIAFSEIKSKVGPEAQKVITENLGSFDEYLSNLIEVKVLELKAETGQ